MKRVTYKQRGDDSFMIEIMAKPSRAREKRSLLKYEKWHSHTFDDSALQANYNSLNTQEGDE